MDLSNVEGLEQDTGDDGREEKIEQMMELLNALQRGRPAGASSSRGPPFERRLPRISHLTEAQVRERMAAGACFGCAKKDHRSRECPKRVIGKDGRVSWSQAN